MGLAVLRHDKLTMLLGDRRLVQGSHRILTAQGLTTGPLVEWMNTMILSMEGDDHLRVRRLVSRAFTPRAVTALRPRMCEIAHELVDGFPAGGGGTVEFMAAFADPFPARVICELLGVPPDLQETVRGWANDLGLAFSYTAAANLERIEAALAGVFAATDRLLAARRAAPADDLLSGLLAAEADGDRLSPDELRSIVASLLFAGQDTTRHQLGLALALFLRHPDQWALLAARPELAGGAVEEVVRVAPTHPRDRSDRRRGSRGGRRTDPGRHPPHDAARRGQLRSGPLRGPVRVRHHPVAPGAADVRRRAALLPRRQPGARRDGRGAADPGPAARSDRAGRRCAVAPGVRDHRAGHAPAPLRAAPPRTPALTAIRPS